DQVFETFGDQPGRRYPDVPRRQRANSVETILLASAIPCFRQPVGIQKNGVTMSQCESLDREARVTEHPQRHAGGIPRRCSVNMEVQKREMARADKLHRTVVCRSSYNQSRELSGRSARWMRAARERSLSKARCSALVRWSRQNRTSGSASNRSGSTESWHVSQSPNVP